MNNIENDFEDNNYYYKKTGRTYYKKDILYVEWCYSNKLPNWRTGIISKSVIIFGSLPSNYNKKEISLSLERYIGYGMS